jgi:hypothetical protein
LRRALTRTLLDAPPSETARIELRGLKLRPSEPRGPLPIEPRPIKMAGETAGDRAAADQNGPAKLRFKPDETMTGLRRIPFARGLQL